jgi:nucleoside-diphosphate-sugar epimerase
MIKRVAVTGGSGATGRTTVAHLIDRGLEVVNLDTVNRTDAPFVELDLRDYDAVAAGLDGCDAVVHLGSNPRPDAADDPAEGAARFVHNTAATFTVMWAAGHLGIERVVWASSQQVFGWPWVDISPQYLPLDENHPQHPQNGYAMSKVACEHLAGRLAERFGMTVIGLRLSNIHLTDPTHDASYDKLPAVWDDLAQRRPNLWGYIDARDAARAVRLALEVEVAGAHNVTIAAADTLTPTPNSELVARFYPGVPLRDGTGENQTLHGIDDARRLLGWVPEVSWRDELGYR